ncbi:MAG: bifunctional riboflavin kinase/FAD synthetase [Bacteroidetes bacterium]|nr:bifunctional riboflavin kinase/FAD synthetase [Bacteroidota bacterium]
MNVHSDLDRLPVFKNAVITIGTFDGVHTGHQQIIRQLKSEAQKINGETVIITFHPHPRKIIGSSSGELKLINTLQEKIELLSREGIDHLVVVPFTEHFSQMTAEEYVSDFLVARFTPHTIIIGYDHRFGKGRQGDYHLMEALCGEYNYQLREIPVHVLNTVSVSSTRIREAIANADLDTANELLGYPFFFEGTIIKGNQLGRTIGYATANLHIENEEKLLPGNGVYAIKAQLLEREPALGKMIEENFPHPTLQGMMNIGFRPTVDGLTKTIEVHLFDFDSDIYGKTLRVFVMQYLRAEQKFNGLDALKEQLGKDKENALRVLNTKTD